MHGLDVDVRALQHDTAVMAYLLDPAPGEVRRSTTSRCATCRSRCVRPTPSPARSTSTATSRPSRPVAGPRSCCGSPSALASALEARELTDLYERFELPLVRVLAEMEAAGIRIDREFLDDAERRPRRSSATCSSIGSTRTRARSST